MPYQDLREFIAALEDAGELARVKAEVDPRLEIGIIMRRVFDERGKAVLFENVRGHTIPLLSGALDTFRRYALAIESAPDMPSILARVSAALGRPIDPVLVARGACHENVLTGPEVDLEMFPVPHWHHLDPERFIGTLGVVVTKDPDTGIRNVGIYREQIQARNRVGLLATQQVGIIQQKYLQRGEPMPVATAIGLDPAVVIGACLRPPFGVDEFGAAGALRGAPVEVVPCRTIPLEVPATAEIVLEGVIEPTPQKWDMEGPFGEFTGYYGGVVSKKPTILVQAVTFRDAPIYQGTLEGMPPSESTTLRTIGHTVGAKNKVDRMAIPGFRDIYITDMSCANFIAIIQMDRAVAARDPLAALFALWAGGFDGKWTIVVDDDVDIFDRAQVERAIATHVEPARDVIITSDRQYGIDLDPSIPPDHREYPWTQSSRIGINATAKRMDAPRWPALPTDAALAQVRARWREYGLP